ncbi:cell division protein FtsQ/DivIB [Rickettsiales endosymbiont of Stachyamoeba lipophora]|uniref:cell division protein FtsQ/DivIB n=1 Tax=Rickettsiales endosymbiont of Stachyamoeba lipophora TaxID=2486578 RepID=UPI0013DDABBA|nr:cell division protein FtsQ/DivIB [Rickettsiales endosymbiont of Stachyamoeba lipophora]
MLFSSFGLITHFGIVDKLSYHLKSEFYNVTTQIGMRLENVYLEGQLNLDSKYITQIINENIGQSIFKVNTWDLKYRIEQLDWVLAASVVRELPDTIHIRVVERAPVAIWQINKKQYLIDDSGHIINVSKINNFKQLPVVVGDGSRLTAGDIITQLKLYPNIYDQISALIRVGNRRWDIRLVNGSEIKLPEFNIKEALYYLAKYQHSHNLFLAYKTIDMRILGKIYVQKK